jgi:membrane protein implicated in regulation of membrane protease activity
MQRFLVLLGIFIAALGLLWPWIARLGLGRLPGDIIVHRPNFTLYFPIVTSLVLSVVLTLLFWLFRK